MVASSRSSSWANHESLLLRRRVLTSRSLQSLCSPLVFQGSWVLSPGFLARL